MSPFCFLGMFQQRSKVKRISKTCFEIACNWFSEDKQMLLENESISSVAYKLRYEQRSSFTYTFKKQVGYMPR